VVLYICVWGIVEVPVLSQESEPQTQIYRTTHSPDLVQALQQYHKHRYTGPLTLLTYYRYFNNTTNTDIQDHSLSWLSTRTSTIPQTQIYSTCTKPGE
jgi:hypothetical protein